MDAVHTSHKCTRGDGPGLLWIGRLVLLLLRWHPCWRCHCACAACFLAHARHMAQLCMQHSTVLHALAEQLQAYASSQIQQLLAPKGWQQQAGT